MDLFVNLAVCDSPSSKSELSLFFGKPPIGFPSGVTTYLFLKTRILLYRLSWQLMPLKAPFKCINISYTCCIFNISYRWTNKLTQKSTNINSHVKMVKAESNLFFFLVLDINYPPLKKYLV